MFKKLLKHDFKAIYKNALPLSIAALACSVIGGISINILNHSSNIHSVFKAMLGLSSLLSALVIVAAILGFQILIYAHFYKNLFTDEGYLTFTLPVKRFSILLSKTLNALIWTTISGVVAVVLVLICMIFAGETVGVVELFKSFAKIFAFRSFLEGFWIMVYILEGILICMAISAMQINLIQFCIAFGSTLAKKHKVLASFGIYYVVNAATSFAFQIFVILNVNPITEMFSFLSRNNPYMLLVAIALFLLLIFIIVAAIAVLFFSLSMRRIKYHLNIS